MNDPILTRFEQLEAEIERLRANLNVRSRTIAALLQRADRAEATLAAVRAWANDPADVIWAKATVLALLGPPPKETP